MPVRSAEHENQLKGYYTLRGDEGKFVSCVAGGRNCGQSGGRKIFFFRFFFFL